MSICMHTNALTEVISFPGYQIQTERKTPTEEHRTFHQGKRKDRLVSIKLYITNNLILKNEADENREIH